MYRRELTRAGILSSRQHGNSNASVLIDSERKKQPVSYILSAVHARYGRTQILLSSITVMELEHGWHRAINAEIAERRRRYLAEVFGVIPVSPFTREMGMLAARIDAESRKIGKVIPTADLLIGATALHHGYSLCTLNRRHFEAISGLHIVDL